MATDIRENKPWTKNQISNAKNNIPKSDTILSGYIAGSMNGGHNKVIAWKQVMAGERHKEYRLNASFKMITPKTPSYQNLYITFRTYFVPNIRVWTNAEKYTAQKGGASEIKIKEIPNLGGKTLPIIEGDDVNLGLQNTTAWRDAYISSYIPRIGNFNTVTDPDTFFGELPSVSVLPLRGRKAIYNDFERNKEYDTPLIEYKGDTVSDAEWQSYLPYNTDNVKSTFMRAKRNNSYYSDYRTELQGFEEVWFTDDLGNTNDDAALLNWASWEMKIAEARSQAENAQANDWDIIAKIRGSKKLSEGKVQLLSTRTVALNYAAVTQNTNNNAPNITAEFRTIGTQGAYSYTNINLPLYAGMEFVEEGYIHVIATISADSVFESGFDRLELNVTPLDQYRPDMLEDKKDVLYECETGTMAFTSAQDYSRVIGFKRKYSEYFKLPNIISGDMLSDNYYEVSYREDTTTNIAEETDTQKTYQFFEKDRNVYFDSSTMQILYKNGWQDYTDLLINKNQAWKQTIETKPTEDFVRVVGQNQVFFLGKCVCVAELPIDDSIKNNYTTWGEH